MSRQPPASELLRSLGLLVDGPLLWGNPVPSRKPGVFVVELPEPLPEAPFDQRLLRRWLEQAPELRLNGARPSPTELAQHLSRFWLPSEMVLYVGRSARALGPRLAALYATPLGARRPHSGGHWLKTLANLDRLRIWWAETDAHEEYEDAVLAEIAARQPAETQQAISGDLGALLPFANLEDSSGKSKAHGLSNYLVELQPATGPAPPNPRKAATRAAPAARRKPAAARPAKRRAEPIAERHYLSPAGLAQLEKELDDLRNKVRPGVVERVKAARELGDLRENAEYESARKEQSFVEGRIQALEASIKTAEVVEADSTSGAAGIGSTVVVEQEGERQTFVLVGASEADPSAGRISYGSPVGQALLGSRPGDEVVARLPRGEVRYTVLEVR